MSSSTSGKIYTRFKIKIAYRANFRAAARAPPDIALGTHVAPATDRKRRTNMFTGLTNIKYAAFCAGIVLAAAGCATTPVPNEKIAVAKSSIQQAEQAGAPEYAPVEMAAARDKLARAEKAAADRDAQPATQLAEQANADAQLAEATAQEQRSRKAATELDASLQALRQESLRNSQPK
jgi:hypothetical protein